MGNGFQHHIERHPWQFFATLTFKTMESCKPVVSASMYCQWLRQCSDMWGIHPRMLDHWPAPEHGEKGGRFHIHALLGSLSPALVNPTSCHAAEATWRNLGGGHPMVRVVDARLSLADYLMKQALLDGKNRYEFNKFSVRDLEARFKLIPAPRLLRVWRNRVEPDRRHRKARDMRRLPRRDHSGTESRQGVGTAAAYGVHPAADVLLHV